MTDENAEELAKLKLIPTINLRGKPIKFTDKPLKLIDSIKLKAGLPKNDALRKHLKNVEQR